jgi:hypothetical protein
MYTYICVYIYICIGTQRQQLVAQKAEHCDVLAQQNLVLEASLMESRAEAGVLRQEKTLDHQHIAQLQDRLQVPEQVCA